MSTSMSFFESIGSPRFISAPMVEQSSMAWRVYVRKHGADLAFTQMMNAGQFLMNPKRMIDWTDYRHSSGSTEEEQKAKSLDKPLIMQLAGNDAESLVKAAKLVQHQVAAVDLNLGCPQNIARRGNYGAFLLEDKDLVVKLLTALVQNLECPVTAKIRVLRADEDTLDLCRAIEACGVQMLTVHGRTVECSKSETGPVNWGIIRKIKSALRIPVVANGGVASRADALRCLEETGADAVMSSEALLENPRMFTEEGDRLFRENFPSYQLAMVRDFLETMLSFPSPKNLTLVIRGHLFKMLYRFVSAPRNLDLRDRLSCSSAHEMGGILDELERRMQRLDFETQRAVDEGFLTANYWYARHRHPYRPHVFAETAAPRRNQEKDLDQEQEQGLQFQDGEVLGLFCTPTDNSDY